jgi:hypothetical protein
MGVVWDVTLSCPKCDSSVRYQTRYPDSDVSLDDVREGSVMEELLEENEPSRSGCWCESCHTRIGFVKKTKTYLEPVIHDDMPKDPTPEEIARVQEYLARRDQV